MHDPTGPAGSAVVMSERLAMPEQMHSAMVNHAEFCFPEEACGLIAVDADDALRMVYATTNTDRSRVQFTVSPEEHFGAIRHAERNGWTIAGSFHFIRIQGPPRSLLHAILQVPSIRNGCTSSSEWLMVCPSFAAIGSATMA